MRGYLGVLAVVGSALVIGALVVGTVAAADPPRAGGMHGTMISRLAADLGVPEARITESMEKAHDAALAQAVKDGTLSQAQADWMDQRHEAMVKSGGAGMMGGPGTGMMGGRGPGMTGGRGQGMSGGWGAGAPTGPPAQVTPGR